MNAYAGVLGAIRAIERNEPTLPVELEPASFAASGRVIRRATLHPSLISMIPGARRMTVPSIEIESTTMEVLVAPVAADLVVASKFAVGDRWKFRAAYGADQLTLAAQEPTSGRCGVSRVLAAHQVVSQHAPHMAASLVGHGQEGRLKYVVERWVDGEPLGTRANMAVAAEEILVGLGEIHQGYGVTHQSVQRMYPDLEVGWIQVADRGLVSLEMWQKVADLLRRDGTVRVSWTHGDPVASNILRTSVGLVFVDWEHATAAPIMRDAAKIHLFSAEPDATLLEILRLWGYQGWYLRQAHDPAVELALAHADFISAYPARRARMNDQHPRLPVYERQIRRQVKCLTSALEASEALRP